MRSAKIIDRIIRDGRLFISVKFSDTGETETFDFPETEIVEKIVAVIAQNCAGRIEKDKLSKLILNEGNQIFEDGSIIT